MLFPFLITFGLMLTAVTVIQIPTTVIIIRFGLQYVDYFNSQAVKECRSTLKNSVVQWTLGYPASELKRIVLFKSISSI